MTKGKFYVFSFSCVDFLSVERHQKGLGEMTCPAGVDVDVFFDDFGMAVVRVLCPGSEAGVAYLDDSLAPAGGTIVGHERETEGFVLAREFPHASYGIE